MLIESQKIHVGYRIKENFNLHTNVVYLSLDISNFGNHGPKKEIKDLKRNRKNPVEYL